MYNDNELMEMLLKEGKDVASLKEAGIRTSSPDPSAYYNNLEEHKLERSGRSIASLLPEKEGLMGTIIPKATRLGGSMGFNPHVPQIVNIDPDLEEYRCIVDLAKVTTQHLSPINKIDYHKEQNLSEVASRAFSYLSKVAAPDESTAPTEEVHLRKAPPGMANTYVVPKSSIGGKQFIEYKSTPKPSKPIMSNKEPIQDLVPVPAIKVTFEIDGFGQLEASYHEVVQDDKFLVLAYNTRYTIGTQFMPQRSTNLMDVWVHNQPVVYRVHSVGIRFRLVDYDITVLLIEETAEKIDGPHPDPIF